MYIIAAILFIKCKDAILFPGLFTDSLSNVPVVPNQLQKYIANCKSFDLFCYTRSKYSEKLLQKTNKIKVS